MRGRHINTGLNQGGAKRLLGSRVAAGWATMLFLSIPLPGVMAAPIHEAGIRLFNGGARDRLSPVSLFRLRVALGAYEPDVVRVWMDLGNLAASMARPLRS